MMRHSRDGVVTAALALLDEVGLPDLTMRRLAQTLDVQASALYHHVPDKQTLLAAVSDRILARAAAVPADLPWSDAVAAHAHAIRDALLAYRDGAEVVASSIALGLGGHATQDRLRAAVAAGGFGDATSRAAASAILHFVLGHVWHEQQRAFADGLGAVAPGVGADPRDLDDPSSAFDFGVALLVDGLAVRVAR